MSKTHKSQFIYTIVTPKQEALIKAEIKFFFPWAKFAFSAPGFVTFKLTEERFPTALACALSWGLSCDESEVDQSNVRSWKMSEDGELISTGEVSSPFECFLVGEKKYFGKKKSAFFCLTEEQRSDIPSRAYYKLAEVLKAMNLKISQGETCVELGSAPGGAVLKMLELGARVFGIDTGSHDETVLKNPHFKPLAVKYQILDLALVPQKIDWLLSDLNLEMEQVLEQKSVNQLFSRVQRGFIFTIKLMNEQSIERKEILKRMFEERGGFRVTEIKVPHHGREFAFVGVKR